MSKDKTGIEGMMKLTRLNDFLFINGVGDFADEAEADFIYSRRSFSILLTWVWHGPGGVFSAFSSVLHAVVSVDHVLS